MQLIVTARQDESAVSYQRSSPDEALRTARDLEAQGLAEVIFSDITGRTYEPDAFDACFVRSGDA